jgi:hypothetical protein
MSETGTTSVIGATRKDETSDPFRVSRKFRANNEIRFTRNALSGDFSTNRHE